jgi:hypothetical protein
MMRDVTTSVGLLFGGGVSDRTAIRFDCGLESIVRKNVSKGVGKVLSRVVLV